MKPFKNPIYVTRPLAPDVKLFNKYFETILKSRQFSNNGQYVKLLELKLKDRLNVPHASAFCNGTIALMIALKALDLRGSVLTTPFTFPATINVLEWCGLKPVFCDVDYITMNISPKTINQNYFKADCPSAILAVHVFGNPCDIIELEQFAQAKKLKLIYDAAHAFDVKLQDKTIGDCGDVTMFSFHATKLFHTCEGGMLTCSDPELDKKIRQLRNFGIENDTIGSVYSGINGKMNELQAIMGLSILPKIDEEKEKRKIIASLYKTYLAGYSWIKIVNFPNDIRQSRQYFPVRFLNAEKRNFIYEKLKENNVFARKYFYPLCQDFPQYKHIKCDVPNAEKIAGEILCLPFYGDLKISDIEKICEIIIKNA